MVHSPPDQRKVSRQAMIAVALAGVMLASVACAGELGDIAASVQSDDQRDDERNECDERFDDPYEEPCDDDYLGDGIAAGLFAGASAVNAGLEFTAYPYENDHRGYLADITNPDAATQARSARLWAEYGSDFDDIDLVGGGMLVEGDHRLGFDLTGRTYFEDLGPEGHDDLSLGDANALFRLWQSNATTMRLGGGGNWLEFDGEFDAGFNVTMSGELYPVRPLILAWEWDAGKIGVAKLFHARGTIGANLRHFEIYAGVDYLDIEDTSLTAMITGLRTWW
jgi:hypothetical protein